MSAVRIGRPLPSRIRLLALSLLAGMSLGACVPAPDVDVEYVPFGPHAPPIDEVFTTTNPDDRIHVVSSYGPVNPGMVRICLWNSASDLDKGMGSGEGEPRHIARNQYQAVCDWYPAGPDPVTWVFYRATEAGEMEQVGSYELDATGYDGVTIIFEWVADAPPLSPPWQRGALR